MTRHALFTSPPWPRAAYVACAIGLVAVSCSRTDPRPPRLPPPPAAAPAAATYPTLQPPPVATVAVPAVPVAPSTNPRATFASAYRLVRARQYQEARPLLESLRDYVALQDYVLYYLALSCARTGSPMPALDLWTQLTTTQPLSIFYAEAALERGRTRRAMGDVDAARVDLTTARDAGDEAVSRRARLELAEMDLDAGSIEPAYEELMALRRAAPGTGVGQSAKRRVEELRQLHPELEPRGAALQDELDLLLAERDFATATVVAEAVMASAPPSQQPTVLRQRADAEIGAGNLEAGLATLDSIAEEYPESAAAPAALFRAATLRWNRDRDLEAEPGFIALRQRYPSSRFAPDALYAIARIEQSSGRTDAALDHFAQLAREAPGSPLARDARWRIGWIQYQNRHWHEAAAAFSEMGRTTSGDDADATYWRARALERAGDRGTAQQLYTGLLEEAPTSYYAYWAAERLSQRSPHSRTVTEPANAEAIGEPPPSATELYHFDRANELLAAGLPQLARAELRAFEHANEGAPGLNSFLAGAYVQAYAYRDAMRVQNASGTRNPDVLYPLAFWPQVRDHTAGTPVDPLLVLALMRQESLFDPEARSPADARGLMQLLPRTAEQIAQQSGQSVTAEELYDPDVNIALGTTYLRSLMAMYNGTTFKALAAYNGGEQAVAKWEARFGDVELDEFVENITYRETRDYVKKVTANYLWYQELYAR